MKSVIGCLIVNGPWWATAGPAYAAAGAQAAKVVGQEEEEQEEEEEEKEEEEEQEEENTLTLGLKSVLWVTQD